jgi:glycosidase
MARISHVVNNNVEKLKLGLAFLYTTRGIPQIYYGTELLWNGDGNNHGLIRLDMPGGWVGDPISIFKGIGLSNEQSEIINLMKLLGDLRQNNEAIGEGNLVHYVPEDNIYVYFRKSANKLVMVILNGNDREVSWNRNRYEENMSNVSMGYDLVDKGSVKLDGSLSIAPFGFRIIELNK